MMRSGFDRSWGCAVDRGRCAAICGFTSSLGIGETPGNIAGWGNRASPLLSGMDRV